VPQENKNTFNFYKLWRNKKSRSVIIQIITILSILIFFILVINNISTNLKAIGKEFSFNFLFWPTAYDITFSPFIDYSNKSTHLRAGVVGALNTLLVAGCGVILATILGFIMGILRLSNNWLVNKIVYSIIDFLRNVPVLLQILATYAIILTTLPPPKKAIEIFADSFFLSNRGFYVPSPVFEKNSEWIGILFIISLIFSYIVKIKLKKIQENTGKIYPTTLIITGIILGFVLIPYFILGMPVSYEIPILKGFNFKGGLVIKPEFLALWFALSLYTACFIAEIVRAGILSVSHGQTEAAYALGLKRNRTLQLIIIPQALRVIIPPLCSQYLNLTKNSSLAIAIAYMDITATIGGISLMQTGKEIETMIIVMGFYLTISLLISSFMNWFNKRIKLTER